MPEAAVARLHARTVGSTGPALGLVHGWGLHGGVWDGVAARLANGFRITLPDLPGHGASVPADPDLRQWAGRLAASVSEPQVWVGWSLGALVTLQLALDHPGRVHGLVLVAATPRFTTADDWPWAVEAEVLERFAAALAQDRRDTLARFLALQVRGSAEAQRTLRDLRHALLNGPEPAGLEAGLEILRTADLRTELRRIQAPVCLISGDRDTLVPPAASRALADALPDAHLHSIAGAGHAPFIAQPETFAATLRAFVGRIGPGAAAAGGSTP